MEPCQPQWQPIRHSERGELTTVQAADILHVSRPFLIKLLEEGQIPYHKVGKHRRIQVEDVMNYKHSINQQREAVLDQLAADAQEQDMGTTNMSQFTALLDANVLYLAPIEIFYCNWQLKICFGQNRPPIFIVNGSKRCLRMNPAEIVPHWSARAC